MRSIPLLALLALLALPSGAGAQARGQTPRGTGDVNGDGLSDVLMFDRADLPGRRDAGSVRIVFGAQGATGSLARANGFRILGGAAHDALAEDGEYMRTIAGDVNGDGLDDVLVAAEASPLGRRRAGAAYIVFGKRDRGTVDLGHLGSAGVEIDGPSRRASLVAVAGAGDMDGDGLDDVLVGASGVDGPGTKGAGAAWVIRGRRESAVVDLAAPGAAFLTVNGAAKGDQGACDTANETSEDPGPAPHCDDGAGATVAGPGDVDGDGIPDLVLDAGRPSVVFGTRTGGTVSLGALGAAGYRVRGVSYTVHAVAAAGDANGDGLADFTLVDTDNPYVGTAAEVIFGSRRAAPLDYRKPGLRALRLTGASIDTASDAGDFTGDGRADLVLSGQQGESGVAFVPFGRVRSGRVRLGRHGVRIATRSEPEGVESPDADPVGDVNGDLRDDVLLVDGLGKRYVLLGAPGDARLRSTRLGARALRFG